MLYFKYKQLLKRIAALYMKTTMLCQDCGAEIPKERLEALPNTKYCVKCAINHPLPTPDPNILCAKASASARNGWAKSD